MWDECNAFWIAWLVFPRLLSVKFTTLLNYHLINWWCNVNFFKCLLHHLIIDFCYSNLTRETGRFELASTITLVLQTSLLLKCASQVLKCPSVLVMQILDKGISPIFFQKSKRISLNLCKELFVLPFPFFSCSSILNWNKMHVR